MADRPPGRDATVARPSDRATRDLSIPSQDSDPASLGPGPDGGRDLDADLSVIRDSAESIPVWLAIWQARAEPDAHARRCASDAISAADQALASLHRVRAWLVSSTRQADDQAAARTDELLARLREEAAP
jgi:hypothetical protein